MRWAAARGVGYAGLMLAFRWKTFSGSHVDFSPARRAYFSGP